MTIFQVCFSLIILVAGVILSIYNVYFTNILNNLFNKPSRPENLLTLEELQQFNGVTKPQLYLAILGNVYDVSKGNKHYGPEGTYNIFVGRDASRSFVTGLFQASDASDDATGLTNQELISLDNWLKFYDRQYTKVGKVTGRYYDKNGDETQYSKEIRKLLKNARMEAKNENMEKIKFPPCNMEWDLKTGSRVWCTRRSGGIERSWIGVPRKLYEPGSDTYRCACINHSDLALPSLQEYENCNPNYDSCYVQPTDT